jgi:hypothetical protein
MDESRKVGAAQCGQQDFARRRGVRRQAISDPPSSIHVEWPLDRHKMKDDVASHDAQRGRVA